MLGIFKSNYLFELLLQAKIIIPIIGSVTIITLAVILVLLPHGPVCSQAKALGFEFNTCPNQPPTPKEQTLSPNGGNQEISPPAAPPEDKSTIEKNIQETTRQNQVRLNSIAGSWTYVGQSYDKRSTFVGTLIFGLNNQFSTIIDVNGYLQPVKYGTYSYSASDGRLTLTFFGQMPNYYTVNDMTQNSFNVTGQVDSASFVRT